MLSAAVAAAVPLIRSTPRAIRAGSAVALAVMLSAPIVLLGDRASAGMAGAAATHRGTGAQTTRHAPTQSASSATVSQRRPDSIELAFYRGGDAELPNVAARLSVFSTPPALKERLSTTATVELRRLTGEANGVARPGLVLLMRGRLVLSAVAPMDGRLYIAPTADEWACYVLEHSDGRGIASGCDRSLTSGMTLHLSQPEPGGSWSAYGFVEDGVTGVDVVVAGAAREAIVADNIFFYEAASGSTTSVRAVVLHYAAGHSHTLSVR